MVATGASPKKAIENIAKQFNTSKSNAGKLIMTESAYFATASQGECYKDLDVDNYEVVGTLDSHTCSFCGEMDGKVFPVNKMQAGSTAPPFHPWCRCTTAPYYEDMAGVGKRFARDIETGEAYYLPADTTYKQWKAMQDAKYGEGSVDKTRKIEYNKNTDEEQFNRFKSIVESDFPKTFEGFLNVKYNDSKLWESYKTIVRSKNYLQQRFDYVWNGEKLFIPKQTKFENVVTIAGSGTDTPIRCVERLISAYGGTVEDWQKRVGKITSDKFIFDIHWYEKDGIQYETKLKNRKERKK